MDKNVKGKRSEDVDKLDLAQVKTEDGLMSIR
jgi:hypothetical protein